MLSAWDLVRPTHWHPMSLLEQSMMDLDTMTNQMFRSPFPMTHSILVAPNTRDDDEFFRDLAVKEHVEEPTKEQSKTERKGDRGFSAYSFSSSSLVDDQGRLIVSTRRRYEDSMGRLKAVHERDIDGKQLKTVWNRKSKDDKGEYHTICSQGPADEFEKQWSQTPFGKAESKKELKQSHEGVKEHQKEHQKEYQKEHQKEYQKEHQKEHHTIESSGLKQEKQQQQKQEPITEP